MITHRIVFLRVLLSLLAISALPLLLPVGAAHAQCSDCPPPVFSGQPRPTDRPVPPSGPGPVDLTTPNTTGIVSTITGMVDTCRSNVAPVYAIDCLRRAYLDLAAKIPPAGDYKPIRDALLSAADGLDAIVTANLDETAPTIRPREKGRPLGGRLQPVRAVAADRLAAANADAAKVIEAAGLLILRSGEVPKRRTAHYQRVAEAMESNMILLRSS
jgi:hypothetical protein